MRLVLILMSFGVLTGSDVWAADATDEPAPDAAQLSPSQTLGREILMEMADFLAGLERFGVTVRIGYDAIQPDGLKVEFMEVRDVTLARPSRLRSEETLSDGRTSFVLFDGAQMTTWDGTEQVYAQVEQPGTVDDALVYYTRDLGMRLPFAPLLLTRLPDEIERRLGFVDYVEANFLPVFGEAAHHIVARTAVSDMQLWIADSDKPFPLRMVVTYRNEPGQPRYWAEFSNWSQQPKTSKKHFRFEPPKGSRQIVFAVQIPPMFESAANGKADQEGEIP